MRILDASHVQRAAQARAAAQQTRAAARALCALLPFVFMLAAPHCLRFATRSRTRCEPH
ncbi:hypothetical protein [Lysobacter enzymogenes]|uniref:hypothetical protein n=1 Tax=Lysobacter enzymogenes TaxID=69 RepID=UPI00147AE0CF|nr:hypothetical protein [Lysobacter enzymogenes]